MELKTIGYYLYDMDKQEYLAFNPIYRYPTITTNLKEATLLSAHECVTLINEQILGKAEWQWGLIEVLVRPLGGRILNWKDL